MQASRRWVKPRSCEAEGHRPGGVRSDFYAHDGDAEKWPLHWRGRIILSLSLICWAIVIGAGWLIWRVAASVLA